MSFLHVLITLAFGLYAQHLYSSYQRSVASIDNFPGFRFFLNRNTLTGILLGILLPWCKGDYGEFVQMRYDAYARTGWDLHSIVSVFPKANAWFRTADAALTKEITNSRTLWVKPVEQFRIMTCFGENILVTEGEEWKRHRKIANPAFSEANNKFVWERTMQIVSDMFDQIWHNEKEVSVDNFVEVATTLTLLVIGTAGFGREVSWGDDRLVPPGHRMSFVEALRIFTQNIYIKLVLPNWALGLTKHLRSVRTAMNELKLYMQELINARKGSSVPTDRSDLFSKLLDARNKEAEDQLSLSDDELIGNIFVFLFAGHETTAHALSFAFALLALHQDEQEKLYNHIKSVIPEGETSIPYRCINSLTQSMAVFYETIRLFCPAPAVPKRCTQDVTVVVGNGAGEKRTIAMPKGTVVNLDPFGLHYNPRYWKDPYVFNPERFNEDWPRDAFIPFSAGPHACIGRRFSETEGIAVLTMIILHYKVHIKDEPQFHGETAEERMKRLLRMRYGLTIAPVRVPLVFERR